MQNLSTLIGVLASISLGLAGCASTKEAVLPQDGPSMKTIYEQHFQEMGARDPQVIRQELNGRTTEAGTDALHGYTRKAHNEIDTIFPRLPNPTLVVYIYPHLAGEEGLPVPGYATTFPMYERVEYALPGEVSMRPKQ